MKVTSNIVQSGIRKALSGEVEALLQQAVAAHWRDVKIELLVRTKQKTGPVLFLHPVRHHVVCEYNMQPEKTVYVQNNSGKRVAKKTPAYFEYTVYLPKGGVASLIKGHFFQATKGQPLPFVTIIKDYNPPPKRRVFEQKIHDFGKKHTITLKRHAARVFKKMRNEGLDVDHPIDAHGFSYKAINGIRLHRQETLKRDIHETNPNLGTEDHALIARRGGLRRERTFDSLLEIDTGINKFVVKDYTLNGRRRKDRINITDDIYTVRQYTGPKYSEVRYQNGNRLELTSFDSNGQALKELGRENFKARHTPRREMLCDRALRMKLLLKAMNGDPDYESQCQEPGPESILRYEGHCEEPDPILLTANTGLQAPSVG